MPDILVDAHLDLAYHYFAHGRDFRLATWQKRQRENKFPGHPYDKIGVATVGMPDMLLARTGIIGATLWASPPLEPLEKAIHYETPREAYQVAMRQLDYYNRLADENPRFRVIRYQRDLDEVLATWETGKETKDHVMGVVLLMEGADPVLEPKQVQEWYERGLRILGPAWMATRYSAGTGTPGKLTRLGHELLGIMGDLNMILDLSHLAEQAFYEAVSAYSGPIIASHSNPRRFCDTDRHLSDDMIRRLVERDGVMGIVLYNKFLKHGWTQADRKSDVPATLILDAIDYVCQIAGSARHVGIGTDWDGGFGWESIPSTLDSHLELWQLLRHNLYDRYGEEDAQLILNGNFLRILRQGLPT